MDLQTAWAMYFAGIVAFQYHPRNNPEARMPITECARVADEMMEEHHKRMRGAIWVGWQPPK